LTEERREPTIESRGAVDAERGRELETAFKISVAIIAPLLAPVGPAAGFDFFTIAFTS
jgi:hypothetical protein